MPRYLSTVAEDTALIKNVYLDGERMTGVYACDTDQGWVDRDTGRIVGDEYERERLYGAVTVDLNPEVEATLNGQP